MSERFPKEARITRSWEYAQVKSRGESQRGRFLVFSFLRQNGSGPARVGIIVSRRVGGAVIRNRVRRRLREIGRKQRLALQPGLWLVIVARPPAAEAEFAELLEEWLRLAKRAAILSTPA